MLSRKIPATIAKTPVATATSTGNATAPTEIGSKTKGRGKDKVKRTHKPPMERAVRLATLADKHARLLHKLIANWEGEANQDQQTTNAEVLGSLARTTSLTKQILLDVDMLAQSGFAPIVRVGRKSTALTAGAVVAFKPKFWDPSFGKVNNFEVVLISDRLVRLRAAGEPRAPQIMVPRLWVGLVDEIDVDTDVSDEDLAPVAAATDLEDTDDAADDADDDEGDEDDDANPDLV